MKLSRIGTISAAVGCWILSSVLPAQAGYWNYGCKGHLSDKDSGYLGDSVVEFDRNALLVMPTGLAEGNLSGLEKGGIYAFEADKDALAFDDPGYKSPISFTRTAYPDQKVVLTEKSRKTISEKKGHLGSRETYTGRLKITYHYQRKGWQFDLPEADIVMDCIETHITAP